jgi:hypothetical protein
MRPMLKKLLIDYNNKYKFVKFQASDMEIKTWKAQGLPTDEFS